MAHSLNVKLILDLHNYARFTVNNDNGIMDIANAPQSLLGDDLPISSFVDVWSSALNWVTNNPNLVVNDPMNNFMFEAHRYFDDTSGQYTATYDSYGATPQRGFQYATPFVNWYKQNN